MIHPHSLEATRLHKEDRHIVKKKCLEIIKRKPGITCYEISEILGLKPNNISGRIGELRNDGEIESSGNTKLPHSRAPHTTWIVKELVVDGQYLMF